MVITFADPTKYFGCELGAQTQFDFKNDRWIVNGSHDAIKLQDLLDGFIRKFVLCPSCDNPETDLIVSTKRGTISQGCKACGFHGPLEFNHKLNTYILKNPPSESTRPSSLDPSTVVRQSLLVLSQLIAQLVPGLCRTERHIFKRWLLTHSCISTVHLRLNQTACMSPLY